MGADTKERIMEAARLTVQDLGYSGLSFRELAKDVGIKSASDPLLLPDQGGAGRRAGPPLHGALRQASGCAAGAGPRPADADGARYTDVFADTLRNGNRMCLAGILAAERNDVPVEVRIEVVAWGEMNERWIARALGLGGGRRPGGFRAAGTGDLRRRLWRATGGP